MLEDEGFSVAKCWRMNDLRGRVLEDEGLSRSVCWRMNVSQGQSAGV